MSTKNDSSVLLKLLLFILGAALMYIVYPIINESDNSTKTESPVKEEKPIPNNYAIVEQNNGLYLFIESRPVNRDKYEVLETIKGDDILSVVGSLGIGKKKLGSVLDKLVKEGQENLVFSDKVKVMAEIAKNKYPDADGLIFEGKLNQAKVIKFKDN